MPYHMTFNTISRVFSVTGKCVTVYTINGEKVKHTFYNNIESAQNAFFEIIASFEA